MDTPERDEHRRRAWAVLRCMIGDVIILLAQLALLFILAHSLMAGMIETESKWHLISAEAKISGFLSWLGQFIVQLAILVALSRCRRILLPTFKQEKEFDG